MSLTHETPGDNSDSNCSDEQSKASKPEVPDCSLSVPTAKSCRKRTLTSLPTKSKRARASDVSRWSGSRFDDDCSEFERQLESYANDPPPDVEAMDLVENTVLESGDGEKLPVGYIDSPPPEMQTEGVKYPEEWAYDERIHTQLMEYRKWVHGTHIRTFCKILLVRAGAPLPKSAKAGTRIVPGLGHLEKYIKARPRSSDVTFQGYLDRKTMTPEIYNIATGSPVLLAPSKFVYKLGDYIALRHNVENYCRSCDKPMASLNGKRSANPDNFRFRACCYPAVTMQLLQPSPLTDIDEVWPFFYDLETTPDDAGRHEIYLGNVFVPEQVRQCVATDPDGHVEITTSAEIIRMLDAAIRAADRVVVQTNKKISVQLVSFNGSKFDDTFLAQDWRDYVYNNWGGFRVFQDDQCQDEPRVQYSERKGALTFNTLTINRRLEVRWTDLFRFVPPTSLRNLARSFKLEEEKGSMPFEALNDFVRRGPSAVRRDLSDGFLDTAYYFNSDAEERANSFAYYMKTVGEQDRTPTRDIKAMCSAYCKQDVKVLKAAYDLLHNLYSTYLDDQARVSPHRKDEQHVHFKPMTMHSLATMAGRILLGSAAGSTVWGYDSSGDVGIVHPEINIGEAQGDEWALMAPTGPTYDFCRQALAGGWVKNYFQGFLIDSAIAPPELLANVDLARAKHADACEVAFGAHDMTDIASMYPVAVTYPMPMGKGHWVETPYEKQELLAKLLAEPDPAKIPKFFLRAKFEAPRRPLFSESTLPQRQEATNALRWSYWDDASGTRIVTSLDVWIACRQHEHHTADNVWRVYDCDAMLYFPRSAQIYRPFMEACAKLKRDGAAEGNELKRTVGKIGMNSGIGKLGQQVEAQSNQLGTQNALRYLERHGRNARLTGKTKARFVRESDGNVEEKIEYAIAVKDADKNRWPIHHAAFMYAATRLMRFHWNVVTRPPEASNTPVNELAFPDTIYGDTDSKLKLTEHSRLMPPEMIGDIVGQFKPELEPSVLTRPFFQIEAEKVSTPPFTAALSGVLTSKKYFVWAYDPVSGKQKLKFKCNGLTQFKEDRHGCPLHGQGRCETCKIACKHVGRLYAFECLLCVMHMLAHETLKRDDDGIYAIGDGYKYPLHSLRCLTLLDFTRVLLTGIGCKIVSVNFERTLSIPTSKHSSFTICTSDQSRSLNRPRVLRTPLELTNDRPSDPTITSFVSGCVAAGPSKPGVLYPSGSYLLSTPQWMTQ